MRNLLTAAAILATSSVCLGQTIESPSQVTKDFIQSVFEGNLIKAEGLSGQIVIAENKLYGEKAEQPIQTALKTLHALDYEFLQELSAQTNSSRSRVFIEVIRRSNKNTDIETFEILLTSTEAGWKIFGWGKISNSIQRLPLTKPVNLPRERPCPTCI